MKTRLTELLGIRYPIVQAGMSWASSCAALPVAVSNAGGLGVIAAGPMRAADFRSALADIKAGTGKPWAVNIPAITRARPSSSTSRSRRARR